MLIVAALAIGWRLVGLTDWPSPAYRTLQYESALASRAVSIDLFGSNDPRAGEWRDAVGSELFLAPPVLPFLIRLQLTPSTVRRIVRHAAAQPRRTSEGVA